MASHPSGLSAGDRVRWRASDADDVLARLAPGQPPASAVERDGTLIDEPRGEWVRVHYDGAREPDSALVELLTRVQR